MTTYKPHTRFVLDRLRETSWSDRGRIGSLISLEQYVLKGGPKSFAEGIHSHGLHNKYPVEAKCIVRELRDGVYTTPVEFRRLVREHELAQQADERRREKRRREERRREQAELAEARRRWLEMGGQP